MTQVLQHAAGDQLAWAATLGVGTGPADNPFAPSGHLEGGVNDLLDPALATARTAWAAIGHDRPAVPTPLPPGELPVSVAAAACALDAAVHAWDIAAALGQPAFLSDDLASNCFRPGPSLSRCGSTGSTRRPFRRSRPTATPLSCCVTSAGTLSGGPPS